MRWLGAAPLSTLVLCYADGQVYLPSLANLGLGCCLAQREHDTVAFDLPIIVAAAFPCCSSEVALEQRSTSYGESGQAAGALS